MNFFSRFKFKYHRNSVGLRDYCFAKSRISFSQSGEDLILNYLFDALGVGVGLYVDVGANDPVQYNNTFLFYRKGWVGFCVEPQVHLCSKLKRVRNRDVVINQGIGVEDGVLRFYEMEPDTLSTFCLEIAESYVEKGHSIRRVTELPIISVEKFLGQHPEAKALDLLSIDIEGDEPAVVAQFVANGARPKVVVCETRAYSPDLKGRREIEKIEAICGLGYEIYADTFINTIFLDKNI